LWPSLSGGVAQKWWGVVMERIIAHMLLLEQYLINELF
jgi:hypothetical protein